MPVLSYRTRGISDAVVQGETGILLAPTAGAAAFANAIEAWFIDPRLYDRLARGGRRHFENVGTWTIAVRHLLGELRRRLVVSEKLV